MPIAHPTPTPDWFALLRGVSRSFYLSIRLLPAAVQAPVAVGYLLARATDTVADTTALPGTTRLDLLISLTQAIALPASPPAALAKNLQDFAAAQQDPAEQALMTALPQALALLQALPAADRADVQQVLHVISSGQQLDLQRFGQGLHALASADELDDYTWRVAGCVGEFWTRVCARHLPGFASLPVQDLLRMGRRYGQGLQRLNLLRDSAADLAQGRCYWPADALARHGLEPAALAQAVAKGDGTTLGRLQNLYQHALDLVRAELEDGLRYSQALQPWRLRAASVLPALIGMRTVAGLQNLGPMALSRPHKVPRREVYGLLLQLPWALTEPGRLQALFDRAGRQSGPARIAA